ncbi:uncharacterized protein LOC102151723 isoform X1 [Canis lupus familiaris]|uniref:uncharacterized protein LOC102151723 isoform X1 n=1 Tax=Canis lupus familiaris TaxID=9615 RepID=UPI0018F5C082|nr:uncharacterized protein LOC102151723 isoform X1 [Canis lupus familiaris]
MLSPVGRGRTTRGIPAPGDNRGNFVGVGGVRRAQNRGSTCFAAPHGPPNYPPPRLCGPRWSPCRSGLPADPADPRLLTPHPEQSPARTWAVVSDAVGCVEGALRPVAQVGQHQAPVTQVGQHQAPLTQITMSVYTVAALPGPWGCSRDSTTACSALAPWPSPSLPTATLPAHGAQTVPLLGVHI